MSIFTTTNYVMDQKQAKTSCLDETPAKCDCTVTDNIMSIKCPIVFEIHQ